MAWCDEVWCDVIYDIIRYDVTYQYDIMSWWCDGMGWCDDEMGWCGGMWWCDDVMLCDGVGWDAMMWCDVMWWWDGMGWDWIRFVTYQYDIMSAWCDRSSLLMLHITSFYLRYHDDWHDWFIYHVSIAGTLGCVFIDNLSHTPLCISMISGVCVQGMWNAQVKGQMTETHRLKVNSHCDTALFISMCDITMMQP